MVTTCRGVQDAVLTGTVHHRHAQRSSVALPLCASLLNLPPAANDYNTLSSHRSTRFHPPTHQPAAAMLPSVPLCLVALLALLHCTAASLGPNATALWTGLDPDAATFNSHTGHVYLRNSVLATQPLIVAIAPSDPSTLLANTSLPSSADVPVSCGHYVHASLTDYVYGHASLWTWDATTLAVVRSYQLPYVSTVLACAQQGDVVLTARLGEGVVAAMRASDGERLAAWQLANMSVLGVAVSERDGLLYVLDALQDAPRAVQVFNLSYNSTQHLYTLPAPVQQAYITTIAVDPSDSFLYLLGQGAVGDGFVCRWPVGAQPGSGKWSMIALPISGTRASAAVVSATQLLVPDYEHASTLLSIDFAQPGSGAFVPVGERPQMELVSALAVDSEHYLYVAEPDPLQVLQLDGKDGRLTATYSLLNGTWCADYDQRAAAMAVDAKRQVYASLCDGRIGVYNQQQQLVDHVLPFNYSAATTSVIALFVSRNSSQLYYTDMAYPSSIFRYDLAQRKVVQTWSNASATYECFAVDERDASIYACNNNLVNPAVDHYASNGTLLSSTPLLNGVAPTSALAVSYPANQLIASVSTTLLAVDLATGAVSATYGLSEASYAGGVAVDEQTGRVYASDNWNSGVLLFDVDANEVKTAVTMPRKRRRAVLRG